MAVASQSHVIAQEFTVIGMRAVLDNGVRALGWTFAAQIRNALLGNNDLDGVFAAVQMADHGNHRADLAALGGGGTGEDG